jgi:predicted Zn-dependent protease
MSSTEYISNSTIALFVVLLLTGMATVAQNKEKEAALGAHLAEDFRNHNKILDSAVAREYVERIGRMLAQQLPAGGPAYTFEIFAGSGSPERELTVFPAGYIFVSASLFLAVESEAEFAGMLAHAMAHAAARHGMRTVTPGGPVTVYLPIHGTATAVPLRLLPLMRGFEREADRLAVQSMAPAGYDPAALLRYLDRTLVAGSRTRIADLQQAIAELPPREYSSGTGEFERIRDEMAARR